MAERWDVPLTTGTSVAQAWTSETGPFGDQDTVDVLDLGADAPDDLTDSASYTRTVTEARGEADLDGILASTGAPTSLLDGAGTRCWPVMHARQRDTLTLCRRGDGDVVVLERVSD